MVELRVMRFTHCKMSLMPCISVYKREQNIGELSMEEISLVSLESC